MFKTPLNRNLCTKFSNKTTELLTMVLLFSQWFSVFGQSLIDPLFLSFESLEPDSGQPLLVNNQLINMDVKLTTFSMSLEDQQH